MMDTRTQDTSQLYKLWTERPGGYCHNNKEKIYSQRNDSVLLKLEYLAKRLGLQKFN